MTYNNEMNEDDYTIAGIDSDNSKELVVFSGFLSYSKNWPAILDYKGKVYKFNGKEPLPDVYVGHYWSMAIYLEQDNLPEA